MDNASASPGSLIRNFSIIAHIDHGKSTLADRLLEATDTVAKRDMEEQLLDNMDLERERGITIKARAVRMKYTALDGKTYILNLIDTPGHVDFSYEVSRSLNACEGAVLVVDATQGIEAQTLANAYLAVDAGLEILPVVNKIDLPSADVDGCRKEIEDIIGIPAEGCPAVSAKLGLNVRDVLEAVVRDVPPPGGDPEAPLTALIFDSYYDSYLGVVVYVRIRDGVLRAGDRIRLMSNGAEFDVTAVGSMEPFGLSPLDSLSAGEVGYLTASIKNVSDTRVGDTVTLASRPAAEPLPGFKAVHPMVYAGIYPEDGAKYGDLRDALEKLQLNDASLVFEPETSTALGFGFRCGFLGLLHMEIIEERLEREFNLDLITTAPSVIYEITMKDGTERRIDNPSSYPPADEIAEAREPIVKASIIAPSEYVGNIMELCQERRGTYVDMKYLDANRADLRYELPLNEIIYDFFDALKSRSRGYASLDYELAEYRPSKLCKLDFLLNGEQVDALSFIVHEEKAYARARRIAERLKENIPRQLFEIPIQAAVGSRIIARETVKALRKDVLAKCYGGDITRKKKLLEKQKEGKKKMRRLGSVQVSPEAFMAVLKLGDGDGK
ncbi:MAG: elongation factor 4 [Clostridia bacterium]|nr:elongation factor 4 [Clostridia bacterium]